MEKRRQRENSLNSLLDRNGRILTNPQDILEEGKKFYLTLYQDREDSLQPIHEVQEVLSTVSCLDIPMLTDEDKDTLDSPFSKEELRVALGKLNTNKASSSDGIPLNFMSDSGTS